MSKASGKSLGSFEVVREITRGGMGVLLLARQPSLDRPAVLKKVRRDLTERPELARRFRREARAAAAIHHHNVVAVYDYFTHRNDQYIAQEFVDGTDLGSVLERKGSLPWRVAALVTLEALRGLEEIHSCGTVHRDLKPSNILLGRRGEVKIADFGIALEPSGDSLTTPGMMIGTPPYMPPEQMLGERMDSRGDLFSLGVVLYRMLTGELPFPVPKEEDAESLLRRMQKERYEPVRRVARGVPRFLSHLVRRCLRARPRRRPSTTRELRQALERRLGNPSPADCRSALACWLWDAQVFQPRENETVVQVSSSLPGLGFRPGRRAFAVGFAAVIVAAMAVVRFAPRDGLGSLPTALEDPASVLPSALLRSPGLRRILDSGAGPPARVLVAAEPDVILSIDGQPLALPPAGEPIEICPGRHVFRFDHPELGRSERSLEIASGEELTVAPEFDPPAGSGAVRAEKVR